MLGSTSAPPRGLRFPWPLVLAAALLAGCRQPAPDAPADAPPALPVDAVARLVDDLRRDDIAAYARHAVPPGLHARLETAWREGRTRWPLTELPLDDQLPAMIAGLSRPDAEKTLMAIYNRQFAGARGELRSTASALGLFAVQYIQNEPDYSEDERDHHVQVVQALSEWGQQAPLSDARKAAPALKQLIAAARLTGLDSEEAFAEAGMVRGLTRFSPFAKRFKQVLAGYGLDIDAALDSAHASLVEQTGDTARVRLEYTLAGHRIDAIVRVERRDGAWYLTDLLRHAEAEAGPVPTPASVPSTDAAVPGPAEEAVSAPAPDA